MTQPLQVAPAARGRDAISAGRNIRLATPDFHQLESSGEIPQQAAAAAAADDVSFMTSHAVVGQRGLRAESAMREVISWVHSCLSLAS